MNQKNRLDKGDFLLLNRTNYWQIEAIHHAPVRLLLKLTKDRQVTSEDFPYLADSNR